MNRLRYIVMMSILPLISFGQNGDVMFGLGTDYHRYDMSSLNTFMSKDRPGFNETPKGEITSGYSISSELSIGVTPSLRCGFFGSFFQAKSTQSGSFLIPDPIIPNAYDTLRLTYEYRAPSFAFGLTTRYHLNRLWEQASSEAGRLKVDAVARLGLGYAFLERSERLTNNDGSPNSFTDNYHYESRDFLLGLSIDAHYRLTTTSLISGIGVRIGYQYYRTANMSNRTGENVFGTQEQVRLHYSGFHAGTFIIIGK